MKLIKEKQSREEESDWSFRRGRVKEGSVKERYRRAVRFRLGERAISK